MKTRDSGATLILSVLLLAAITVLVGFGRLAMYRNQVKLRLDREREIQQELATRSAMRWLEACAAKSMPNDPRTFLFPTVRGDIVTTLVPANPIFPAHGNPDHFDILDEWRCSLGAYDYVSYLSQTHGSPEQGKTEEGPDGSRGTLRLADEGDTGEIRLDLPLGNGDKAVLWTERDSGLRYLVNIESFAPGTVNSPSDHLRMAITPSGQAVWAMSGAEKKSEYAIWIDQYAQSGTGSVTLELHARKTASGDEKLGLVVGRDPDKSKGIQLAGTTVSIIDQALVMGEDPNKIRRTEIPLTEDLDQRMGEGFTEAFHKVCKDAGGIRLTVQVESSPKPDVPADDKAKNTVISQISIRPAYEYMTELSWAVPNAGENVSEVSTLIRCKGPEPRGVVVQTVTYDTHGTYANRKGHLGDIEK